MTGEDGKRFPWFYAPATTSETLSEETFVLKPDNLCWKQ